ncbi:hypothetical protein [Streptomyces rhizosphaericus]|uniref:hypothetical protein n=1 Tax=Streptomyces rhizosphaericus TaxID=114699 RepID=UPI00362ECB44
MGDQPPGRGRCRCRVADDTSVGQEDEAQVGHVEVLAQPPRGLGTPDHLGEALFDPQPLPLEADHIGQRRQQGVVELPVPRL